MKWYTMALYRWADFKSRSRRKEYWMFTLMNLLFSIAVGLVCGFIGGLTHQPLITLLSYFYSVFTFLPSIAAAVRRLHDVDFRGWWILFPFVNFVLLVLPGTQGPNRFGADPKGAQMEMPSPNQ